ncbi:hypothetical protein LOCC1_G007395 [Lachnellula occidentalis]|uniref:Aminoglycoside phosphotransferase domain-containing protein n=1 Tax=Lachnellula occidentalis TaxID=215460 RepID=A0A8H8RP32_9HELO|nr:hypothetical protein LOCC1_G007395 [Lachnellula occidentalis]
MATSENSSLETNNMVQQEPPNDSVMAEQVDKSMLGIADVSSHDSEDAITTKDESTSEVGDMGSDDGSENESNGDGNAESASEDEGSVHGSNTSIPADDAGSNGGEDDEEAARDCESTTSTFDYEQESFETYQIKVVQLCHDIGHGEPSNVERMEGGSFNRIIGLTFASSNNPNCILRIPRYVMGDHQVNEISDQVSLLRYLSTFDFLGVPSILAYDFTTKNALGSQYVLQTRIPGERIQDVFYKLPMSEKLQLTTKIAELVTKLTNIGLTKPGRLIGKRTLPDVCGSPPTVESEIDIVGFRANPSADLPGVEKQPLASLLKELLEMRKHKADWPALTKMWENLQVAVEQMEMAGIIRKNDVENVLCHWDLSAKNILIQPVNPESSADTPSQGCKHSVSFAVDDAQGSGHKHTVQVLIEDASGKNCSHTVNCSVSDSLGKTYRHTLEITEEAKLGDNQHRNIPTAASAPTKQSGLQQQAGKWEIGGVIDWDDSLSVPLVLARSPCSWVWLDQDARSSDWDGNRNTPPGRDLTPDELLIKAHFDQTMERLTPGYIEDTYHRGVWLRRVAELAIHGVLENDDFRDGEKIVEDWSLYFTSIGLKDVERGINKSEPDTAVDDNKKVQEDASEDVVME